MSVLDKNLEPDVTYSDIYASGSVYFAICQLESDRSTETPYLRGVEQHTEDICTNLQVLSCKIGEISIETMIATVLSGMFYTESITVFRATPLMYQARDTSYEYFTAVIGAGHYQSHPVSSCKIILQRKSPEQLNHLHST